jgi:hypothetical protein
MREQIYRQDNRFHHIIHSVVFSLVFLSLTLVFIVLIQFIRSANGKYLHYYAFGDYFRSRSTLKQQEEQLVALNVILHYNSFFAFTSCSYCYPLLKADDIAAQREREQGRAAQGVAAHASALEALGREL